MILHTLVDLADPDEKVLSDSVTGSLVEALEDGQEVRPTAIAAIDRLVQTALIRETIGRLVDENRHVGEKASRSKMGGKQGLELTWNCGALLRVA